MGGSHGGLDWVAAPFRYVFGSRKRAGEPCRIPKKIGWNHASRARSNVTSPRLNPSPDKSSLSPAHHPIVTLLDRRRAPPTSLSVSTYLRVQVLGIGIRRRPPFHEPSRREKSNQPVYVELLNTHPALLTTHPTLLTLLAGWPAGPHYHSDIQLALTQAAKLTLRVHARKKS